MALRLPDPKVEDWASQRNFDDLGKRFPLECSTDNFREFPQARVYHNGNPATDLQIANNTATILKFNSERWDKGTPLLNMHDTVTNNSRLTCRVAGLYDIKVHTEWELHATGRRYVFLKLNGATYIGGYDLSTGNVQDIPVSTEDRLAVGDYVEVEVFQTSGGNLNIVSAAQYTPEFMMSWRSP